MANRYWMGGNWSSTASWSATNNGAGGASVPTSADSVFWHTIPSSSTYTIDATSVCLDMDWTGATNNPTLAGSSAITITGSLTRITAMTWTYSGAITFNATTTGKTLTSAGGSFQGAVTFNGVGGGWTLQDALNMPSRNITLLQGALVTNNKAVTCSIFNTDNSNTRSLTLGASIFTCNAFTALTTTGLTFDAGTSTIIMTGNGSLFDGGGKTFNNVTFSGGVYTISGSNTFNTLNQNKDTILNFTSGTTQTITNPVFNGTTALPSTLQSVTAGTPATIALPAGRYFIRHTSIKDITITGATTVTSIAGTNVSGNTGITFVTKFEMGRIKNDGSLNWYSAATGASAKVSG